MITAAGTGSRLGRNLPKCLVEVGGRAVIDYQLDLLREVEDVRIVIGYQRARVMEHVRRVRSDAIFVCNHSFASTNVLQSLDLAVQGLRDSFLVLDGDVIPEPASFRAFLRRCEGDGTFTAVCPATSTDPVYAVVESPDGSGGEMSLVALQREPVTRWEWPGISYLSPAMIEYRDTFVYQQVQKFLPMPAVELTCWEIDTPDDLARAEDALRRS